MEKTFKLHANTRIFVVVAGLNVMRYYKLLFFIIIIFGHCACSKYEQVCVYI